MRNSSHCYECGETKNNTEFSEDQLRQIRQARKCKSCVDGRDNKCNGNKGDDNTQQSPYYDEHKTNLGTCTAQRLLKQQIEFLNGQYQEAFMQINEAMKKAKQENKMVQLQQLQLQDMEPDIVQMAAALEQVFQGKCSFEYLHSLGPEMVARLCEELMDADRFFNCKDPSSRPDPNRNNNSSLVQLCDIP